MNTQAAAMSLGSIRARISAEGGSGGFEISVSTTPVIMVTRSCPSTSKLIPRATRGRRPGW
jgi:hypothetical protein